METDGVGVTTLAAGAGCPLHCKWCINKKLLQEGTPQNVTAEELIERVKVDNLYFLASGGGITFGGGEPLLYADFISEFRKLCPPQWKITVETSLFVPRNYLAAVTDTVDLFIVDCKDMSEDTYRAYTGEDVSVMKENLEFLLQRIGPDRIIVKVPLIPEYNTVQAQEKSAEELRKMGVERLNLFEYVIRS
jgi:pyruvate formate lyase activating enzyme